MGYKIEFDRDKCMGCGVCTVCNNWKIEKDGLAKPVKTEIEEVGCNKEAEEICPAGIIKISENGK